MELNEETLHMLGYLTEEKWKDAFRNDDLNKDILKELLQAVDKRYNMHMYEDIVVNVI